MKAENEYKKGLWTEEEDRILMEYIRVHGGRRWNSIPRVTGLNRGGRSCRLRWLNYLSPNVKRGHFSEQEEDLIIRLHNLLGNRWSLIAGRVPGRTDNQVKNYWNTHLSKKLGIKKQPGKSVRSTKAHPSKAEGTSSLLDNSNFEHLQDPVNIGETEYGEMQVMENYGIEELFFPIDHLYLNSPGLMDFLDGCPSEF